MSSGPEVERIREILFLEEKGGKCVFLTLTQIHRMICSFFVSKLHIFSTKILK